MKRTFLIFALIFPALILTSCLKRSDSLAPIISITSPRSGTVRTADNLIVRGYAIDDEGIVAIRVDGVDLLDNPVLQSQKGKKLVEFGFRSPQIDEGQWTKVIAAEDSDGRVSSLSYTLEIDTTPPVLELDPLESLSENRYRVKGIARDNQELKSIQINDVSLAFPATAERVFSLPIERAEVVTVIVEDSAGNKTTQTLP